MIRVFLAALAVVTLAACAAPQTTAERPLLTHAQQQEFAERMAAVVQPFILAGGWQRGDVAPARGICLSEAAAVELTHAWEAGKPETDATIAKLEASGDCGQLPRAMPAKLVRPIRTYTDYEGDTVTLWEMDIRGTTVFALVITEGGPHEAVDGNPGFTPVNADACAPLVHWSTYRDDILSHPDNARVQMHVVTDLQIFVAAYNRTPPVTSIDPDAAFYFTMPDDDTDPDNDLGFLVFVHDGCVGGVDRHAMISIRAWERGEVRK